MDEATKKHLETLIQYNWNDEARDFEEHHDASNPDSRHIFRSLVALDNFLNGTDHTPEVYLRGGDAL